MFNKITEFFNSLSEGTAPEAQVLDIEVACAVLLFEVINADGELTPDEQDKLQSIIEQHFL